MNKWKWSAMDCFRVSEPQRDSIIQPSVDDPSRAGEERLRWARANKFINSERVESNTEQQYRHICRNHSPRFWFIPYSRPKIAARFFVTKLCARNCIVISAAF